MAFQDKDCKEESIMKIDGGDKNEGRTWCWWSIEKFIQYYLA